MVFVFSFCACVNTVGPPPKARYIQRPFLLPRQAKKMIEEVGTVKANSTADSQVPVKRKRGRPPKNQPSLVSEDLRDLKQKRAQKLLKEALKQVSILSKGKYIVQYLVPPEVTAF